MPNLKQRCARRRLTANNSMRQRRTKSTRPAAHPDRPGTAGGPPVAGVLAELRDVEPAEVGQPHPPGPELRGKSAARARGLGLCLAPQGRWWGTMCALGRSAWGRNETGNAGVRSGLPEPWASRRSTSLAAEWGQASSTGGSLGLPGKGGRTCLVASDG